MDYKIQYKLAESKHFPVKVTCFSKLTPIQVIKEKLSPAQLASFKTTCFGKLMEMQELQFSGQLIHSLLLMQIESSDANEMWFALPNGKPFRFSIQEFCLVTGLNCEAKYDVEIDDVDENSGSFCEAMLNGTVTHTTKTLEAIFKGASSDNDEDMVKLALLYFLEAVLLGKDHKNHVGKKHIEMLNNLDTFNHYPWGRVSYEMTLSSLKRDLKKKAIEYHKRKQDSKAKLKSDFVFYSLNGFPYAFQIWACEAIPTIGNYIAKKSKSLLPRIINWSTPSAPTSGYLATLFSRKDVQAYGILRPTPREAKEDYCKQFLSNEGTDNDVTSESEDPNNALDNDLENVKKATTPSFEKPIPSRRQHHCPVCNNVNNEHKQQLEALKKQLEQFQEETNRKLDATNKKLDLIINFLVSMEKDDIHDETEGIVSSPMEEDVQDGETDRDMPPFEDVEAVRDGGRCTDHTTTEEDNGEKKLAPIVSMQAVIGSPSTHSAASVVEIPKPSAYTRKRKRRKGKLITSPFEPLEIIKKKRSLFNPCPKLSAAQLTEFEAWLNGEASGHELVALPIGAVDRKWFNALYTPSEWLDGEHIDFGFFWIRKTMEESPTIKMLSCTTTDSLFQQYLWSRCNRLKQVKDVWEDDDQCIKYTNGSKHFCRPWVGLQKVYIPLNHANSHWVLVEVDFKKRTMVLFDSLDKRVRNVKDFLKPLTTMLPLLLKKIDYCMSNPESSEDIYKSDCWTVSKYNNTPQQETGSGDCGIFIIKMAEYMIHGASINSIKKDDVPYYRKQLALAFWGCRA